LKIQGILFIIINESREILVRANSQDRNSCELSTQQGHNVQEYNIQDDFRHTTNQNHGCYDQGNNKEGVKIVRIMLVTQAVIDLGYFILAPLPALPNGQCDKESMIMDQPHQLLPLSQKVEASQRWARDIIGQGIL
jgi:hypothetical protein